jgi:hypothetical protein
VSKPWWVALVIQVYPSREFPSLGHLQQSSCNIQDVQDVIRLFLVFFIKKIH